MKRILVAFRVIGSSVMLDVSAAGSGTPYKHQWSDFPDIACASCTISSVMFLQLCRDANGTDGTDDMVGDVAGLYFDCHYQINTPGSWAYATK